MPPDKMSANSKRIRSTTTTVNISQENPWSDATAKPKRTRSATVPVAQDNPWSDLPSTKKATKAAEAPTATKTAAAAATAATAATASAAPQPSHSRTYSTAKKQRAAVVATVQSLVPASGRPVDSSMAQYHWDSIMALQQGVRRLNREIAVSDLELRDLILKSQLTRSLEEREALRDQGNKMTVELLTLQKLAGELRTIMIASLDQAAGKGPKRVSIDLEEEDDDDDDDEDEEEAEQVAPAPIAPKLKETDSIRNRTKDHLSKWTPRLRPSAPAPVPASAETSTSASLDNEDNFVDSLSSGAPQTWSQTQSSGGDSPDLSGLVQKSPYPTERTEGLAWLWDEPDLVPKPLALKVGAKKGREDGLRKTETPTLPQSKAEESRHSTSTSSNSVQALRRTMLPRDESIGRQTLSSTSSVMGLARIDSGDELQTLSSASSTRASKAREESQARVEEEGEEVALGDSGIISAEHENELGLTKITSAQSNITSTSSQQQSAEPTSHPTTSSSSTNKKKKNKKNKSNPNQNTKPKSFTHRLQSSSGHGTKSSSANNSNAKIYQLYRLKKTCTTWANPEILPVTIPQREIEQKIRIGLKNTAGAGFITVAEQLGNMKPKRRRMVESLRAELNGGVEGEVEGGWEVACVEDTHVVITARETRDVRVMEVIFERGPRSRWTGEVKGKAPQEKKKVVVEGEGDGEGGEVEGEGVSAA